MEVSFCKILWKLAYICEGGSVFGSSPNTGLTGKFCACFRQNVAKQHNFLRIINIWIFHGHLDISPTFCQHVNDM